MKIRKISLTFVVLALFWAAVFCDAFGDDNTKVYDYEISAVYEYQNCIDAVDVTKNRDFSGSGNVLFAAVKENGRIVRAKAVYLDENMPVGVSEIKLNDFAVGENQTLFITVWNSIEDVKPLTDGSIPEITKETVRIEGDESEWTVSENGKSIIAYIGEETDIQIPSYLCGKHITKITPKTSPDNMASIFGSRAEEITSLTIPEGIVRIGATAFYGCKNIRNELVIPSSVSYIGFGAFLNCRNITGEVVIPEKLESISPYAFAYCYCITSVKFGKNLKVIWDYAFYCCESLSGDLDLPDSVGYIGDYAFTDCEALDGTLSLGGAAYIGNGAFAHCGFTGALNLPENLTYIGFGAFEQCEGFTGELVLPKKLEHIGDAAFNHCTGFTNAVLTIPASAKTLGGDLNVEENTGYSSHLFYDFGKDTMFKAFEVEYGNEYFCAEDGVLYSIDKTRLIAYPRGKTDEIFEIPEGVVQIDELAFSRCKHIKELVLPDSYVLGEDVPANVINQDGNTLALALYNYTGVEKISVKETNPNYISKNGILYNKDGKSLWYCPTGYAGEVVVSDKTERIEKGAFYGAATSVSYTSVYIPASVTYIAPETVVKLNDILKNNITVAEGNGKYTVKDGTLKAVE